MNYLVFTTRFGDSDFTLYVTLFLEKKSIMKLYILDNLAFNLELLIDVRMTQLGIMKYEYTSLAFLSEYLISNSKYINSKLASKILKI